MTATEMTNLGLQPGMQSQLSDADTLAFFEQHEIELEERLEQMNFRWNAEGIHAVEARLKWVRREIERLTPQITFGEKVQQFGLNVLRVIGITVFLYGGMLAIFGIDASLGGGK